MPNQYQLNNNTVYLCDFLPSENVDTSKYVMVFEPSTKRHLTVRKHKIKTVKATNPLERLQETMQ